MAGTVVDDDDGDGATVDGVTVRGVLTVDEVEMVGAFVAVGPETDVVVT